MSLQKVQINEVTNVLEDILSDYGDYATQVIREEVDKESKQGLKELKRIKKFSDDGSAKKYARGWKLSKTKTYNSTEAIIYNKDAYQLTHLLEKGHYLRNGQFWKGKEHIKPVNDDVQSAFIDNVMKRLKG